MKTDGLLYMNLCTRDVGVRLYHVTSAPTLMFLADIRKNVFLQHMHTLEASYPFGDEVSTNHQVILGNPAVAWENWKKPAPRRDIQRLLFSSTTHCTRLFIKTFSKTTGEGKAEKESYQTKHVHVKIPKECKQCFKV